MSTNTLPIVGAYFRPPAKILIESLAVGTPLYLLAEPDNHVDPNAVAVYVEASNIPETAHAFLEEILPQCGFTLDAVLGQETWHLGYIPKDFAKQLRESGTVPEGVPLDVTFATNVTGAPRVRFSANVL